MYSHTNMGGQTMDELNAITWFINAASNKLNVLCYSTDRGMERKLFLYSEETIDGTNEITSTHNSGRLVIMQL